MNHPRRLPRGAGADRLTSSVRTHEGRLHEDAEIRGAGLTDDPLCEILRNATWPTGRVLCGDAQMQTYGWESWCKRVTTLE